MMKRFLAILLVVSSIPCFASLGLQSHWVVRTGGNDTNGGCFDAVASPGTDYSNQDAAQVAFTDLVIGATTTQLTSVGNPFTSDSVGNCINVTGGTGFTTGRYSIKSVAAGVATMDRSVGTAASTGGTGNLGGAFASIGAANTSMGAIGNTYNQLFIGPGSSTYTLTSTITTAPDSYYVCFNSSLGDTPTPAQRPLITTATNSTPLFFKVSTHYTVFSNCNFSNTASVRSTGIEGRDNSPLYVYNAVLDGFTKALDCDDSGATYNCDILTQTVEIKNSSVFAIGVYSSNKATIIDSYIHDNAGNPAQVWSGDLHVFNTVISNSTSGYGAEVYSNVSEFRNSALVANNGSNIYLSGNGSFTQFSCQNTVMYGSVAGYGLEESGTRDGVVSRNKCSFGGNFLGALNTTASGNLVFPAASDITLTSNPFTSSTVFTLNNTAGGGALLKAAGYPASYPGTMGANGLDAAPVQSAGSAGGSSSVQTTVQN